MIDQPQSGTGGQSFNVDDLAKIELARALEAANATPTGAELIQRVADARREAAAAVAEILLCLRELSSLVGDSTARLIVDSTRASKRPSV